MVGMLRGLMADRSAPQATPRDQLTPELAAHAGTPLQIATFPGRDGTQVLFSPETRGRGALSWRSPSGEGIVTEGGLLLATRGLGGDLMIADLSDVPAALAGRTRQAERVHRYLDGENHLVARAYVCDYTRAADQTEAYFRSIPATRVTETCSGLNDGFENRYWIDGAGRIVRSVEWVSAAVGHVEREQLAD